MNSVDRAGSVSEISPGHSFVCKNIEVFIWEAGLARLPRSWYVLVCISTFDVCELALLVKLHESTKLWQSQTIQVYVHHFGCVFESIPVDRAEISHMNTPQNSSRWAHMKRPWIKSLEDLCWNLKDSCRDLKDPCAQGSKGSLCLDLKDLCRNLKDLYKNFKVLYRILKDLHKDPKVPCRELKDLQYTNLKDPCRSPKDLFRNQKDLCRNLRDPWMKDPYRDHK